MYSKLCLAVLAGLAIVAQADHAPHAAHAHLHKRNETTTPSYPGETGSGQPIVPAGPFGTGSVAVPPPAPLSTGAPLSPYGTGASAAPLSTGAGPTGTATPSSPDVGNSPDQAEDSTLTYTLGSGSSTTVVTTVIHRTITKTNLAVIQNPPLLRYKYFKTYQRYRLLPLP